MKDDESIEEMYSRLQTLVCGLQILKKSYVASDHVSKILRRLLARWRPKVTAIEEAKDLNTLSVKDLVSSLKVHEICNTLFLLFIYFIEFSVFLYILFE